MNVIKEYLNSEFRKLPRTRYYRELKKNILLDCNDKYDEYLDKYGDKAQDIIIDEIGNHKELYHGGLYLIEWFSIISSVLAVLFLVYIVSLTLQASTIRSESILIATINGLPVLFIMKFVRLFMWIIIGYALSNLLLIGRFSLKREIKISKGTLMCLYVMLWIVVTVIFKLTIGGGGFPHTTPLYIYYLHGLGFNVLDFILGCLLTIIPFLYIQKIKYSD